MSRKAPVGWPDQGILPETKPSKVRFDLTAGAGETAAGLSRLPLAPSPRASSSTRSCRQEEKCSRHAALATQETPTRNYCTLMSWLLLVDSGIPW